MSIQDENMAVIRGWFEGQVWGNDDHEAAEAYIDAHYAPDGKAFGLDGQFEEGPASFKSFRMALVQAFPKQAFTVTHLHACDDTVWVRYEGKLTAPDGQTYSLIGGGPLAMVEGRITKAWNLVNFLDLLTEAGALPSDTLVRGLSAIAAR